MNLTIWKAAKMTPAERQTHIDAGGTVSYPLSFWALCVVGALSAWFMYALATQPLTPQQIENKAERKRLYDAEIECAMQLREGAKIKSTFDFTQSAAKKNEAGYIAEVYFSTANAFGVRFEYIGVCQVVDGKVTGVRVHDR